MSPGSSRYPIENTHTEKLRPIQAAVARASDYDDNIEDFLTLQP